MKIVWSSCNVNCGSRCPLRVYVDEGKVVRVEADNTGEGSPGIHEIRACLRGRALRKWVYSPERLLYPLKRVGKRGEGKFERISWGEALDTISGTLRRVIDTYGNEAVSRIYGTGNVGGVVSGREQIDRLMNLLGGQLNHYNSYSTAQISQGMTYTYGTHDCSNYLSDIVNAKLVVFFGNDPAEARMSGGGTIRDLVLAEQESKVRIIVIDPRYSDTAAGFADEWIPIRPGTDAALVSGLAYLLITENLVDKPFLQRYCVGYDESTMPEGIPGGNSYKDYILGSSPDRIPKTPEWAAAITGIPADRIVRLAREIGTARPAYIAQGWGPQRHANGEQSARAICMLPILTGNVGIPWWQQRRPGGSLRYSLSVDAHGHQSRGHIDPVFSLDQGNRRPRKFHRSDRRFEGEEEAGVCHQVPLELCEQHLDEPAFGHGEHRSHPCRRRLMRDDSPHR